MAHIVVHYLSIQEVTSEAECQHRIPIICNTLKMFYNFRRCFFFEVLIFAGIVNDAEPFFLFGNEPSREPWLGV